PELAEPRTFHSIITPLPEVEGKPGESTRERDFPKARTGRLDRRMPPRFGRSIAIIRGAVVVPGRKRNDRGVRDKFVILKPCLDAGARRIPAATETDRAQSRLGKGVVNVLQLGERQGLGQVVKKGLA